MKLEAETHQGKTVTRPRFTMQCCFLLSGTQGRTQVEARVTTDGSSSLAQLWTNGKHRCKVAQYPLKFPVIIYYCVFKINIGCLIYPEGVRVSERRPIESLTYFFPPKKKKQVSSPGRAPLHLQIKNEGGGVFLHPKLSPLTSKTPSSRELQRQQPPSFNC